MTDVLEKIIAELETLRVDIAYRARLAAWRDSLRALVEAQKSAKPTDAAERLARRLELNGHGSWAFEARALGREHAQEIERLKHACDRLRESWERERGDRVDAEAKVDDLRKSLDARVAELSEAHAAMNGMMPKGTPCSEHEAKSERATNRAIAAEAKAKATEDQLAAHLKLVRQVIADMETRMDAREKALHEREDKLRAEWNEAQEAQKLERFRHGHAAAALTGLVQNVNTATSEDVARAWFIADQMMAWTKESK